MTCLSIFLSFQNCFSLKKVADLFDPKSIAFLLIISSFPSFTQSVTPDDELDYVIQEFTLPGGRSGNNVNAIVQGPYGFMWFGSHGGLHRYDGYDFVTYKPVPGDTVGETTSLTYPYVESLYWDSNQILWVSSFGGGLFSFDPITEKFKNYKHDPDDSTTISHPRVLCAVEDAQGNLWFGTEHGLNRLDKATGKFKRYYANPNVPGSLHNDDVRSFYVDKEGTLWIGTGFILYGTDDGGLSRYNPESDSFTNFLPDPKYQAVRGILEDSRGNFWVGTKIGLCKFNRSSGTFERMKYDPAKPYAPGINDLEFQPTYSIMEDRNGGLWVGIIDYLQHPTHLIRYDTTLRKNQEFPMSSSAWQTYESNDGTIWVAGAGTSGKVQKITLKSRPYNLRTDISGIRGAYMRSPLSKDLGGVILGPMNMTIDPADGHYWLQLVVAEAYDPSASSSLDLILAEYNPLTNNVEFHLLDRDISGIDFNSFANQMGVKGLEVDKEGAIWGSFFSGYGLFRFDPNSKTVRKYLHDPNDLNTISSNEITTLMIDSRGEIWAATFESGLNRINPATGKVTHYHFDAPDFGDNDNAISIIESRDGKILIGGSFNLLEDCFIVELDPATDVMRKIILPGFMSHWLVVSMAQSVENGNILMALGGNMGGIAYYDWEFGDLHLIDAESGFAFNNVAGVVSDKQGYFWLADVESSLFVRVRNQDDFVFEEADRVPNQWRSGILGANGKIYFTTRNGGWVEIDPDRIKPEISQVATKIKLVDLFVRGEKQKPLAGSFIDKPIWLLEELILPSNSENFSFRFSEFNYQTSGSQFHYRLYPFEVEWKRAGSSPVANYYQVPSGKYSFQVRSLNISNNTDTELNFKVVILPPWWSTWWAYGGYGLVFIGGVFVVDRVQRRRLIAKANAESKEKELAQAREIEKAYNELKATQTQLIQSEKMASLGELTAGIAHEIQNPLNFVNNFSEVNEELLNEMKEELSKGKIDDAITLANDAIENQKKIYHHGKRADGIVKGMLQHSRGGNDVKEPTDINALADEYLRLAYHGLRAKDKSFNAKFETHFDASLPKIQVVPQDIGRVILNLITNAFYAVSERLRQARLPDGQVQPDSGYEPMLTVTTRNLGSKIEISVKDNGNGIADAVKEKIFQPFFTTKPTGQGTGLGLSMSYDIVKSHGGDIRVNSSPGLGSEFIITLIRN
ncbi:MAG TPA: two-component regulator propeller domain-containing protein [Cyclobacteriaceae bacterium]